MRARDRDAKIVALILRRARDYVALRRLLREARHGKKEGGK